MDGLLLFLIFMPFAAAPVCYVLGQKHKTIRDYFADLVTFLELVAAIALFYLRFGAEDPVVNAEWFAGLGIHFTADGFRAVYACVCGLMWFSTTLFSKEYFAQHRNRNRYYLFMLLTLGATMGVFLSADLYTTFIFFEIMSFTSYVWVAQEEKPEAMRAAQTYLAVAVIGGMVMLMGLFLLYRLFGDLQMENLMGNAAACDDPKLLFLASLCLAIGFGAKAGAFPLHIWLPKAHPVAPAPASALLSGILTKSGIYGLVIVSVLIETGNETWGRLMLGVGLITMFQGALLALFSVDLKKTLACSSVSQIGFILTGIGLMGLLGPEKNALAARGTLLHMVNHSLFKLVLFLIAGVIFMNLHKLDLNEIRGYGRKKAGIALMFLCAALGISGVPLFSGYVSKTLLHESIVEYAAVTDSFKSAMEYAEIVFLITGGLTFAYMTKLFVAIFVEKNADPKRQENYEQDDVVLNGVGRFAIGLPCLLILLLGMIPRGAADRLADIGMPFFTKAALPSPVVYFSPANLKGALISVTIGLLVYFGFVRLFLMRKDGGVRVYLDRWPEWMDLENTVYRPLLAVLLAFCGLIARILDSAIDFVVVRLRKTIYQDAHLQFELPEGTIFTYHIGRFLNHLQFRRMLRHPGTVKHRDYVHELALRRVRLIENRFVIARSLSFGLLLLCLGFMLTTVYLLSVHW